MTSTAAPDMAWADDFLGDDDFSVDDLLVEPEQDVQEGIDDDQEGEAGCFETSSRISPNSFDELPSMELDFHITEDVAELEWVSRFVGDSFFEYPPSESFYAAPAANLLSWRPIVVPVKARSKRRRRSFSASISCNSSTTTTSSTSARASGLVTDGMMRERKRRGRKKKKKIQSSRERKCGHCGVEKTPQWRAGPMGAKTLCNACGVRFKSGRLLPEYRPACSPTFVRSVHSNSHRKVLEMRRKKGEDEQLQLVGFC